PPKGHAFQITEEQGRTDRQQDTTDVAHDENEKSDVKRRDPVAVDRDPGTNQKTRGADGAEHVSEQRAGEKEKSVVRGRGAAADLEMNSGRDDKETAHHDDEARVIAAAMQD